MELKPKGRLLWGCCPFHEERTPSFKVDAAEGATEAEFIAGAEPDITLTDANYKTVVWVNARKPEGWMDELQEDLSTVWGSPTGSSIEAP